MKSIYISLKQEGQKHPEVRYASNNTGTLPQITRSHEGVAMLKFPSSVVTEGKMFVPPATATSFSGGQLVGVTTVTGNDVDGEVYIVNTINGTQTDGWQIDFVVHLED